METVDAERLASAELAASRCPRSSIPTIRMIDPSAIPVVDNGEALIPVESGARLSYLAWYCRLGLDGASEVAYLRRSVAAALVEVAHSLPDGSRAWPSSMPGEACEPSPTCSTATLADPSLPRGYVADPNDSALVPPHTTGGAVDLTLTFDGEPLLLGTPFDHFGREAWSASSEHADLGCRHLRRLLYWEWCRPASSTTRSNGGTTHSVTKCGHSCPAHPRRHSDRLNRWRSSIESVAGQARQTDESTTVQAGDVESVFDEHRRQRS